MTDRKILSNAIDKAIINGWILEHPVHTNTSISDFIIQMFDSIDDYPYMQFEHMAGIIFSHSFAKAFFSEELYRDIDLVSLSDIRNSNAYIDKGQDTVVLDDNFTYRELPAWKFHLQQMVLEENPIKYLERFL